VRGFWLILLMAAPSQGDGRLERLLDRVSEEAEIFRQRATRAIGRETLRHRGRLGPPRLVWGRAPARPEVRYNTREIVSEYGFGQFQDNPEWLREFRQVLTVDGRNVLKGGGDARQALAEGMTSEDDRRRMSLLRDFERYGQVGAATDFGQSILLFRRRELSNCEFHIEREEYVGASRAVVIAWRQKAEHDAARVFTGRKLERVPMHGLLWVREDGLPLRMTLQLETEVRDGKIEHWAEIEYQMHQQGFLLPLRMTYRKTSAPKQGEPLLLVENQVGYGGWQLFQADAEIRFTPLEEGETNQK
jgi:hypothetical protein